MGLGKRIPSYRRHKSGQARVTILGKDYLLGPFDTDESRREYARLIAEYLASGRSQSFGKAPESLTVADVVADYLRFGKTYFGELSKEYKNIKRALAPVIKLYADFAGQDFGPNQFKTVRADWISPNRSRGYVNGQMARVLRFLKWAVGEGKMPSSVFDSCKCVAPLKSGKCDLEDTEPIAAVPIALVESTILQLTQVLADMVRFQLATACRPGELVKITPAMVDRSSDVWVIELEEHKTASRGKSRTLYVGPKGQDILRPYLLRGSDQACFSPRESERQRLDAKHAARVTPLSCGNKPGSKKTRNPRRPPGDSYDTASYAGAIRYACKRAKLQHWTPNQLRHTAATLIRKQFGLEAAQVILGHSELTVTQVYAEIDREKAIEVARKIG